MQMNCVCDWVVLQYHMSHGFQRLMDTLNTSQPFSQWTWAVQHGKTLHVLFAEREAIFTLLDNQIWLKVFKFVCVCCRQMKPFLLNQSVLIAALVSGNQWTPQSLTKPPYHTIMVYFKQPTERERERERERRKYTYINKTRQIVCRRTGNKLKKPHKKLKAPGPVPAFLPVCPLNLVLPLIKALSRSKLNWWTVTSCIWKKWGRNIEGHRHPCTHRALLPLDWLLLVEELSITQIDLSLDCQDMPPNSLSKQQGSNSIPLQPFRTH